MVEITVTQVAAFSVRIVASLAMTRKNALHLRRKKPKSNIQVIITVVVTGKATSLKMSYLLQLKKIEL
jgi:hypothetical protein